MVTKKDIANKRLLVKDMEVICNKEDAVSVEMFVQELRKEPYNTILLYKWQHETDKECPSLAEDTFLLNNLKLSKLVFTSSFFVISVKVRCSSSW